MSDEPNDAVPVVKFPGPPVPGGAATLPPRMLFDQVTKALMPEPPAHVHTLWDNLPAGISDPGVPSPELKLPPPTPLYKPREPDELVAAFGKITRVGFGDIPSLGWVYDRLEKHYPALLANFWRGRLRNYMNNNEYFFMKTERAIALASLGHSYHLMRYVNPHFVLHQDLGPEGGSQKDSQGEREAVTLVREMREWGKLQGATEMRWLTQCSDLPGNVYVRYFEAKRREEVWMAIK